MIEEAGSDDPQVEKMESTADELAHDSDKLQGDIEDARDDWESKQESQSVPGAVPDPEDEESGEDDEAAEDDESAEGNESGEDE